MVVIAVPVRKLFRITPIQICPPKFSAGAIHIGEQPIIAI
jgi:hypothetical protein